MANQHPAARLVDIMNKQKPKFLQLDAANGHLVEFQKECLFARQQLLKNSYTLDVAAANPNSLQGAILNVAAIGISLNPASAHAYLVPRDKAICLDISYRGLVKLATDCGAIQWAKVELVYESDDFEWNGPAEAPTHRADPFSERGNLKGGYCIAKLPDGTVLTEVMPVGEINKIRDTSKAFKSGGGPWVTWYEEMAKKTILKRAYKSWPQTGDRRRLDTAVEALHQSEGAAYTIEQHTRYMEHFRKEDALNFYLLRHEVGTDAWCSLFNSFPKGEKTKNKAIARELESKGEQIVKDYLDAIEQAAENEDESGLNELLSELEEKEREFILARVNEDAIRFVRSTQEAS